MAATAYKEGNVWRINQFKLSAGTCVGIESDDGLYLQIKLIGSMDSIAIAKYTDYFDNSEPPVAYTKETLTAFLDTFFFRSVGVGYDGSISLPDPDAPTLKYRLVIRGGVLCLDQELTATGFAGDVSTDDGATGDWINIKTI